jgi:hypothetical protein
MEEEQNKDGLNDETIEEIRASVVTGDGSETRVTQNEFARFIGDNAENYLPKFRKFNIDGDDNFVATWHWPAFFFGFIWIAYRRMYAWALVALFLETLMRYLNIEIIQHPVAGEVFIRFVYGIIGNWLYYKYAKKRILELKGKEAICPLEEEGGVNRWVDFIVNKEVCFRSKKRATETKARDYAKYIIGVLTAIPLLFFLVGIVLQEADLLLGGLIFSLMLLVTYYIPAVIISNAVPKDQRHLWIIFFLCVNVIAMAAFWYLYVYKNSYATRNRREEE